MSYHHFTDDHGEPYGSFEVFYDVPMLTLTGKEVNPGWYWWPCFPGCVPDGEAIGPFDSEAAALADALQ